MLISFEGIDGCGKSTQIEKLTRYLKKKQAPVSVFREPGGTIVSEKVREILLDNDHHINEVTELLLFSAARSQLITEKVMPLLEKGEVVILDRFFDSTIAYQGYGRKSASLDHIHLLNEFATHGLAPDLTFYLKITPDEAAKRTAGQIKDRMENAGTEFFSKVTAGYDQIASIHKRVVIIDAMQSADIVFAEIRNYVSSFPKLGRFGFNQ